MKLSPDILPRKSRGPKSTDVLLEAEERNAAEFNPRRHVPARLWEDIERRAQHASIPELKSNTVPFILRLLALSVIDEKIRKLLQSRDDLIQFELNRLPIMKGPEGHGVTPGGLDETANLLQVVPELGPMAQEREKPESDGYKWYTERPLDDFNDYLYWSKQPKPMDPENDPDPEQSLITALESSVAAMRLFPADRSELKTELLKVITPADLLNEAKKQLEADKVGFAMHILAYARLLIPENTTEYQEMVRPYWPKLKNNLQTETPHHGWEYTAFHATILAAHEVWIDQEGKIIVQLQAPAALSSKPLPERSVA